MCGRDWARALKCGRKRFLSTLFYAVKRSLAVSVSALFPWGCISAGSPVPWITRFRKKTIMGKPISAETRFAAKTIFAAKVIFAGSPASQGATPRGECGDWHARKSKGCHIFSGIPWNQLRR